MQAAVNLQEYYHSVEWMDLRWKVLDRCDSRCERCGKGKVSHVIHVSWDRKGHELPEDLLGLCKTCHKHQFSDKLPPSRNYKNFMTLTELSKKIGVTVPGIRKQLLSRRFVAPHIYGFGGRKTMYIPTKKAFDQDVCYEKKLAGGYSKSGAKGTGTWKWDIDFIRHVMGK